MKLTSTTYRRIQTGLTVLFCSLLMSAPRADAQDVALFAGGDAGNSTFLKSAETFDSKSGLFFPTENDMSDARVEMTATTLKNKMVLVAGGTPSYYPLAS